MKHLCCLLWILRDIFLKLYFASVLTAKTFPSYGLDTRCKLNIPMLTLTLN